MADISSDSMENTTEKDDDIIEDDVNGVVIVEEKGNNTTTTRPVLMKRFASLRQNLQSNERVQQLRTSAVAGAAVAMKSAEAAASRVAEEVRQRRDRQTQQEIHSSSSSYGSYSDEGDIGAQSSSFHGRYRAAKEASESTGFASQKALLAMTNNGEIKLNEGEYYMVLGQGMLGVNLKQCLQLRYGVYVDFLVSDGAADRSQVIHVGDALVRVNDIDVSQGTIHEIPQLIAKAKRPAVIVLSKQFSSCGTALHHAIGLCLKLLQLEKLKSQHCVSSEPITQATFQAASTESDDSPSIDLNDSTIFAELSTLANERCNENSFAALSRAIDHPSYLGLLKQAFLECCGDPRKTSFISKHFANEDSYDQDENKCSSTLFKLYLRLFAALALLPLAPPNAKNKLVQDLITELKPLFSLLNTTISVNESLIDNLQDKLDKPSSSESFTQLLEPLQSSLLTFLATSRFARFLVSDQCARMRAYLRGTAPFYNLSLHSLQPHTQTHNNIYLFMLLHAICHHKNSDETRYYGPAGICCAISIYKYLHSLPLLDKHSLQRLSTIWTTFLCEKIGLLDDKFTLHSDDTIQTLNRTRSLISSLDTLQDVLNQSLHCLADQLLFDYANYTFPKFKDDDFYETFCREIPLSFFNTNSSSMPNLNGGCISRLLRNTHLPDCISIHRPHYTPMNVQLDSDRLCQKFGLKSCKNDSLDNCKEKIIHESLHNADFAVIFGTSYTDSNILSIRRFGVIPLNGALNNEGLYMKEHEIPSTLELYASAHHNPLESTYSKDGWNMSLINFIIPNSATKSTSNTCQRIHGVSLVIHKNEANDQVLSIPSIFHSVISTTKAQQKDDNQKLNEPSRFDQFLKRNSISTEIMNQLKNNPWSDSIKCDTSTVIGISFISARPVIPAMRSSLSSFAKVTTNNGISVKSLVDVLGSAASTFDLTLNYQQVLNDHVLQGSEPFVKHNLSHQINLFEEECGIHLMQSLGPVTLSLLFLVLLLEQKVVLVSERRSLLLSVSIAIMKLIEPLEWSHLNVSYVPTSLAYDLVHYPAPFLIGIVPSEEREVLDNLPDDVTLVDLDSSVIQLACDMSSAHSNKSAASNVENIKKGNELKFQLNNLSKHLGYLIGQDLFPSWRCDSINYTSIDFTPSFVKLKSICHDFVVELLEGTSSCCYWIEEEASTIILDSASISPIGDISDSSDFVAVLFDEDRFHQIKDLRYQMKGKSSLVLDVQEYPLILKTFLRCQGLSTFISSSDKKSMIYW